MWGYDKTKELIEFKIKYGERTRSSGDKARIYFEVHLCEEEMLCLL